MQWQIFGNTSFHLFQKFSFKQMFPLISNPATSVGMFTVTKDLQSLKVADAMDLTLFGNFTVACHRDETIFVDPLKSKNL